MKLTIYIFLFILLLHCLTACSPLNPPAYTQSEKLNTTAQEARPAISSIEKDAKSVSESGEKVVKNSKKISTYAAKNPKIVAASSEIQTQGSIIVEKANTIGDNAKKIRHLPNTLEKTQQKLNKATEDTGKPVRMMWIAANGIAVFMVVAGIIVAVWLERKKSGILLTISGLSLAAISLAFVKYASIIMMLGLALVLVSLFWTAYIAWKHKSMVERYIVGVVTTDEARDTGERKIIEKAEAKKRKE